MVVVVVVVVVGVCVHLIFDVCMCVYIVVCSVHACKMAIVVGGGLCDSCRCLSLLLLLEGCGGGGGGARVCVCVRARTKFIRTHKNTHHAFIIHRCVCMDWINGTVKVCYWVRCDGVWCDVVVCGAVWWRVVRCVGVWCDVVVCGAMCWCVV